MSEYEVMCAEDLLETNRRVRWCNHMARLTEAEGGKGDDYPTEDEKPIIRNEQSGAY